MNIQHRQKLLVGGLLDNTVPAETGAIDNDVDRIEGIEGGIDNLLRKSRLHQISAGQRDAFRMVNRGLRLLQRLLIQVAREHIRAR